MGERVPAHDGLRSIAGILDTRPRARAGVLGALFIGLTALGAQIAAPLPFTPLPVTLQTLFVLLAGIALGPRAAFAAMGAYVLLGAAGLPIFAGGGAGPAVLFGPTGGYLLGFPFAAGLTGALAGDRRALPRLVVAWFAGTAVIFLGGVTHIAIVTGSDPARALALGFVPFLGGALLKAAIGIALTVRYRNR